MKIILLILLILIILLFINQKEQFVLMYQPKPNNSSNIVDTGILRNLRWTNNIFSIHREISHKKMDKIIGILTKLNINYINTEDHNDKTILKTSKHIISVIDKYSNTLDGDKTFSIRNVNILRSTEKKIVYNIEIFRKFKTHSFTLQIDIDLDNKKFNNVTLLAVNIEDIHNNPKNITFEDHFKLLGGKMKKKKNNWNLYKYRCYENKKRSKFDCISYNKFLKKSIWDKPCESDSECPFYNTKYNKGGCKSGYCDLPINVDPVGYRGYKGTPLCKNCNKKKCIGLDCFDCCEIKKKKNENLEYYF